MCESRLILKVYTVKLSANEDIIGLSWSVKMTDAELKPEINKKYNNSS